LLDQVIVMIRDRIQRPQMALWFECDKNEGIHSCARLSGVMSCLLFEMRNDFLGYRVI